MMIKTLFFLQVECNYSSTSGVIPSINITSTNQDEDKTSICNINSASVIECTAQAGSVYAPSPASPPATTVTDLLCKYCIMQHLIQTNVLYKLT